MASTIRPYSRDSDLNSNFPLLEEQIRNYYDVLIEDHDEHSPYMIMSPRHRLEHSIKIGFREIFYYINFLYDKNPSSVIDIGCGECLWKKWFPNIIGFDPNPSVYSKADFVDRFDEDFSKNHFEFYDCGMAINSIHFVSWENLSNQIDLAMNVIKPDGRFLFTINFDVLNARSSSENKIHDRENQILRMDKILLDLSNKYSIFLIDYLKIKNEDGFDFRYSMINGHARFILEK